MSQFLKKVALYLIISALFFAILFTYPLYTYSQQESTDKLGLSAKSAILVEAHTGQILFEKNSNLTCFPASTTKVLTALVAISYEHNLNKIFKVSSKATMIEPGSSSYYLNPGETISFQDLLYAMLLISANDAANVIAENISGNIPAFVEKMNQYAKSIGAENSHFVNPNGLHSPQHYTTAYDLSLIARQAYQNEILRKIFSTVEYRITTASMHKKPEWQIIYNINKLLRKNSKYYYPYATGIKTGYTAQAKRCLIASAKKDNIELIAVILSSEDAFSDAIKLFNYGFNNFKRVKLFSEHQIVGKVLIDKTNHKWLDGYLKTPVYVLQNVYSPAESDLTYTIDFLKDLKLPIYKDTVIGNVYVYSRGYLISSIPVLSYESYEMQTSKKILQNVKKDLIKGTKLVIEILAVVVLCAFLFTVITIIRFKRKKMKLKLRSTKTIDFTTLQKRKLK
ncbi:D-alanyl-D-alanine carboxypeptidase (penicillin-binding protein 5/6) [Caldicellulosiruptor bescii]|uniref:serine-type D-Ala-D-Ala carboxypeptidase n=2 Tax=Caldicellulosiruptor bescii TaxID=31899 RepID=B9MRQ1_CALBD|nr:D-alanyl-D-alanine carboxypeptidase family protein [Caldicellulosiruptor bescii]ACM60355.1 Serine-type D-Ala-D-Ala carboxypeptidase [Caldicellulosiruptor bescii DSM 6725]PBC87769.1 D-alanyl-D-alanine carboxypeptidase (penicillin-binding protein 5/6) [Caldicellulosiruptor bescii]PBC90701.1 D-alanyl-D-alanine carboxypeptidase (penicillin-binding protein 5/6) [Caldicellulosiruptor bescii]PBD03866.1 D-alanyl-D-alanine carboxypeptidase (penicillin-binding protein 5/6) [Caldicellulosiruptor bescii